MAELTTIARPYAEAAFALAQETGTLPVWATMLRYASAGARSAAFEIRDQPIQLHGLRRTR